MTATPGHPVVILRVKVVKVSELAMWLPMCRLEKQVVLFMEIRTTLLDLVLVKFRSVVPRARASAIPTVGQVQLLWCVVLSTRVQCLGAVTATFLPLFNFTLSIPVTPFPCPLIACLTLRLFVLSGLHVECPCSTL